MRDLLSKVLTGSMIAGAALLVTACGGGESTEANNTTTEMGTTDPMMDTNTGDVTAIDGAGATGDNMALDTNMTMDANATTTTTTNTTTTDAGATNGM